MEYVIAVDQGTTSSRAIVFDRAGEIISLSQREFPQIFPQPGWVEHDPQVLWQSQRTAICDAVRTARLKPKQIAGIGVTNQRETTVLWDRRTGDPLYNAIVWQDRRTAGICAQLEEDGLASLYSERTGLVLDPYFSGTKLAWLLRNVSGAMERAVAGELAFGTIDSWLLYKLTKGQLHITDASNASRTLLYNIHRSDWDEQLLEPLGIPRSTLPEVRQSSEVYGTVSDIPEISGVPIAGILGDQQAAMLGQACLQPGTSKNTYGTGCFLLMNTGENAPLSKHGLLTTIAWAMNDVVTYAVEGSVFIGGAIVQWLRDGLGIIEQSSDVRTLAASVHDSDGVFLVPALTGLGAPHWDPHARGTLLGLTRGTTSAHIARAAIEAIAYQVADLVHAMELDAGQPLSELRVDGGAAVDDLLLQFQADILQKPVVRPSILETTALGAAYAAGLATNFWRSTSEITSQWKVQRVFEPTMSADQAEHRCRRWAEAIDRSRRWDCSSGDSN